MATSRSIDPANLLEKDATLLGYYLKQHDFKKCPYFISFVHRNRRIHLTNYLQERIDENKKPYYLIVGTQLKTEDNDPYDTYIIVGTLTFENDYLKLTKTQNHFLFDSKEINPYHLTPKENEFLYQLFKAAVNANPRKLVFHEHDYFSFTRENVTFEYELNFTTKLVCTKVNKSPIGKESAHRWRPLGKSLGRGSFGEVFDASLKLVPEKSKRLSAISTPVVMKITRADAEHERDMLKAMGEKPKKLTSFIDQDGWTKSILAMRRCRGRELFDVLDDEYHDRQYLTATQRMYVALNFAMKVRAIHQRGILHVDLKPENALVDENGNVEIVDFGLSMLMVDVQKGQIGTYYYMAPEVLSKKKISIQSDVFSLACVLRAIFNVKMSLFSLDEIEDKYQERLAAIDLTQKDAEKKKAKALEEIAQMFYKYAKTTDSTRFMHANVEGFTSAQKDALEKLYINMHHVKPHKRPSLDEVILCLENILLGVLIHENPEQKIVLKDMFERAGQLRKELLCFDDATINDEAVFKLCNFFYKNKDVIPEQFDTHFVRMLGIKTFDGLETRSALLKRVKITIENFVAQHQLVINYRLKAAINGGEKFQKDVEGVLARLEGRGMLTIDHLAKLTEQFRKDIALLNEYYPNDAEAISIPQKVSFR